VDDLRTRRAAVRITERDRELLEFVANHRLVLASHVQALLGLSLGAARSRLRKLTQADLLTRDQPFQGRPSHYQITRRGLAVVGSELPRPREDLRSYEHDIGIAWLWLAARRGALGSVRAVVSERELRSHDARPEGRADPLAVRLGGMGPAGRARLHYPDLLLQSADGRRIAIELELTSKGQTRRERILSGYAADRRIDAVLYFVEERSPIARRVRTSARRLGISSLVHVQYVRPIGFASAAKASRRPERTRARRAESVAAINARDRVAEQAAR
jgi:hypothetical protein